MPLMPGDAAAQTAGRIWSIIAAAAVTGFVLFLIVMGIWALIARPRVQTITVVRKRQTANVRNATTHYTIDCTYPASDQIHTLDCTGTLFQQLKKGRTYTVTVRRFTILAVGRKH